MCGDYGNDRILSTGMEDVVLATVCWNSCDACPTSIIVLILLLILSIATDDDESCILSYFNLQIYSSEYAEGSSNNKYLEI